MHPGDIRFNQNKFAVYQLIDSKYRPNINLDIKSSWTNKQKSLFIESILLLLRLDNLYIDATIDKQWEVINGRQRLLALYEFYNNKLVLEGLEFFPQYNGLSICDIPFMMRNRFEGYEFQVYIVGNGVPNDIKNSLIRRFGDDRGNEVEP